MRKRLGSYCATPVQQIALLAGVLGTSTPLIHTLHADAAWHAQGIAVGLWLAAFWTWINDPDTVVVL